MKRIVGAMAALMLLAAMFAGAANAQQSETIKTTLSFPTVPSTAPYVGTYSGTFSASGAVSDTNRPVTAQALFGAVSSPVAGVLQTVRTLSGANGTLTLRCTERIFPLTQPPSDVLLNKGSCVVLGATGSYAELRGSGQMTGSTDFSATPMTVSDTLTF